MSYQRPILATLALFYCLCLGLFALFHNPHSRLNRSFALYNFCNALYNTADYVFLFRNHSLGLLWDHISGIGGCLMIAFLMSFVFELLGIAQQTKYKRIETTTYVLGIGFSVLCLTPLIVRDVRYEFLQSSLNLEVPGPLYFLFAVWILVSLLIVVFAIPSALKTSSELQRKRATYVILACLFGFFGLCAYFVSLCSVDLPAVYYPLQGLVAFTFGYAIFKHNLISVSVAFKRASVLVGIYLGIVLLLAPIMVFFRHSSNDALSFGAITLFVFVVGVLFSFGPIVYGYMVKWSTLLQDASTSHLVHEFKTPLATIQSAKAILDDELAKSEPDAAKVKDYMEMIQRNTERLEGFVMAILDTAKAGGTSNDIQKEEIEMGAFCRDVMHQMPALNGRLKMEINVSSVRANKEGIRQVLLNLLSNAAKFCPINEITLRVDKLPDGVEVSVQDKGTGIAREDLERIFRPFVQSSAGQKMAKGSGLGLAIANKWVEAHDGKIWAESEGQGKGTRFIFFLPQR